MPRISRFEVLERGEQLAVSIRLTTPFDKLPQIIGESYGKVAEYLKEVGVYPSDVPFET